MHHRIAATALGLLALLGAACASTPGASTFRGDAVLPDTFGLIILRTGENPPELSEDEQSKAFAGHFAFMGEAAERGDLLLAGPFGQPKDVDDFRGLFVFDVATQEETATLGAGDPTTQMGVFRQEAMTLDTLDLLRHLPEMLEAREAERAAAGEEGPDLASYTVMFAPDGPAALAATSGSLFTGRVVLLGRLGEPREDALFGIFDVSDPEEVRARLAASGLDVTGVELARWYATPVIREFARPQPTGDGAAE